MGVPYPKRGVNIISVAVDAPQETVSALSGKIGRLNGVTAKTVYAPAEKPEKTH
jgi:putative iron-only hydrogenase system regulator